MTLVLLDHPWPLEFALNAESPLKCFNDWIRSHPPITPVRFIALTEYEQALQGMSQRRERTQGTAFFQRFVYDYVRLDSGGASATVIDGPGDIRDSWNQALYETIQSDSKDWRTPQIVAVKERQKDWPSGDEVTIRVKADEAPQDRVFAIIDEYEQHRYATSDFDPWDLRRCHHPPSGRLRDFPCCLPKHPALDNVSLSDLPEQLRVLRKNGWQYQLNGQERYCYIPPANYDIAAFSKEDWRNNCKTFPREEASGGRGSGPIDDYGRVWVWDRGGKRHWDVQFPTNRPEDNPEYWVISHTGELIRKGK